MVPANKRARICYATAATRALGRMRQGGVRSGRVYIQRLRRFELEGFNWRTTSTISLQDVCWIPRVDGGSV